MLVGAAGNVHRVGEASLFVGFGPVRRGEHFAAPAARRRPQIAAAGPRVGAVHIPAVLGHVLDRLPVTLGALQPLRAVLFLDVNLEVISAREQLPALFAFQEIASIHRGSVFWVLPIRFVTALFMSPESS